MRSDRVTRLERQRAVFDLWCSGYTEAYIAEIIGITPAEVKKLLKTYRKFWTDYAQQDNSEHVSEIAARIDRTERELWACFERTKQTKITQRAKRRQVNTAEGEGPQELIETTMEQTIQAGDPGILGQLLKVQYLKMRLFGLVDAEGISGAGGPTIPQKTLFVKDTRDETGERMAAFLASAESQPSDGRPQDMPPLEITEASERAERATLGRQGLLEQDINGEYFEASNGQSNGRDRNGSNGRNESGDRDTDEPEDDDDGGDDDLGI